jgi:hypothetical protein
MDTEVIARASASTEQQDLTATTSPTNQGVIDPNNYNPLFLAGSII